MNDNERLEKLERFMDEIREQQIRADERSKMLKRLWEFVKVWGPPIVVVLGAKLIERLF